jgi:predicted alpha/beta-fold hydrolase
VIHVILLNQTLKLRRTEAKVSLSESQTSSSERLDSRDFRPAWWVPGPHVQTIWGSVTRSRRLVRFRRERLEAPDGDELVLDHVDPGNGRRAAVRLILLHGLEGSSYSVYVQGLAREAERRGWSVTAFNFRSCARDPADHRRMLPNRRARLYHSGETEDLDFLIRTLARRAEDSGETLLAAGTSLGGNVLLKWLGEHPDQREIRAAAALSTPYDLAASDRQLDSAIGRLYVRNFLRTFWEFDDAANAPLHGFAGADDYYARASSIRFLPRVTTPTLCLSAQDDPFLPAEALSRAREAAAPAIEFRVTPRGGHIGFVGGPPWRPRYWAEESAVRWLAERL